MPISEYITRREYIVTAQNFDDLDSIYSDIETLGKSPAGVELERNVTCVHRRPTSRNTHYLLTDWEAGNLTIDPRIKSVTLASKYLGIRAGTFGETQTSTDWDKSSGTASNMKNWGLLRCTLEDQLSNWGGAGYEGNGIGTSSRTATIALSQTGRNVDVVVCDSNGIVWNHPEFNSEVDGSGVNRAIQYNWFQHNDEVYPTNPISNYVYGVGDHSTHVAGNTQNGQFELPAICVGAIDTIQVDQKVQFSDCGPGVDIWAPGTFIVSSLPTGTVDPRSNSYYIGKYSGTSMASPQVCGVLACALEVYPDMNQYQAKEYILAYAKANKLTATTGGPTDDQDLQGAANLMLFYYREKELSGNTLPKINYKPRPVQGAVFPRPRIRRTS